MSLNIVMLLTLSLSLKSVVCNTTNQFFLFNSISKSSAVCNSDRQLQWRQTAAAEIIDTVKTVNAVKTEWECQELNKNQYMHIKFTINAMKCFSALRDLRNSHEVSWESSIKCRLSRWFWDFYSFLTKSEALNKNFSQSFKNCYLWRVLLSVSALRAVLLVS